MYEVEGIGYDFIPTVLDRSVGRAGPPPRKGLQRSTTCALGPAFPRRGRRDVSTARGGGRSTVLVVKAGEPAAPYRCVPRPCWAQTWTWPVRPSFVCLSGPRRGREHQVLRAGERGGGEGPQTRLLRGSGLGPVGTYGGAGGGSHPPGLRSLPQVVDRWFKSNDEEAFTFARMLIAQEGLLCGEWGALPAPVQGCERRPPPGAVGGRSRAPQVLPAHPSVLGGHPPRGRARGRGARGSGLLFWVPTCSVLCVERSW